MWQNNLYFLILSKVSSSWDIKLLVTWKRIFGLLARPFKRHLLWYGCHPHPILTRNWWSFSEQSFHPHFQGYLHYSHWFSVCWPHCHLAGSPWVLSLCHAPSSFIHSPGWHGRVDLLLPMPWSSLALFLLAGSVLLSIFHTVYFKEFFIFLIRVMCLDLLIHIGIYL